jgi:PIN domain nuclease of toxin-antitoxin system
MKILLDTHVFLWSKGNDPRMSPTAWSLLKDPNNDLFLSAVSVAEMAIKSVIGKLALDVPLETLIHGGMQSSRVEELPFRADHALRLSMLPFHHRDPFDRMIIASAMEEGWPLLSNDPAIRKYPVHVIW